MKKLFVSVLSLLCLIGSLPATAVVSLHGASPHAFSGFVGFDSSSLVVLLLGTIVIAGAMTYRFRQASH